MASDRGLPVGTSALATALATRAAQLTGQILDGDEVVRLVRLPQVLVPDSPGPRAPVRLRNGSVHVDLGPDDEESWATLQEVLADENVTDAEDVAVRAQEWRLAVTPYRTGPPSDVHSPPTDADMAPLGGLRGVRVIDITAMWAGPLCTRLLADAGASVTKIEPGCRLDGIRSGPGSTPDRPAPMFVALNKGKDIEALDLRRREDRRRFEKLVAAADLVVDSLSQRARDNLGLSHDELAMLNPAIRTLSIPAFPSDGPQRDWVAYGTGVHAVSGCGWDGEAFVAPEVSYPDPLAGLTAFIGALGLLAGEEPAHTEVSLLASIAPLFGSHIAGPDPDDDDGPLPSRART